MESLMDVQIDWIHILPSEIWFYVVEFLDPSLLLKIRTVCKLFNHLATEEILWKRVACLMSPKTEEIRNGADWLHLCKTLYKLDMEGNWNIGIAMDMNLADSVYPLSYELKTVFPKKISQPDQASGLIGAGCAPWGEFTTLTVQWGIYFTVLNIYQWNLWLTCYVGELSNDSQYVFGTWKTTWQYASGQFAGHHLNHLNKSAKAKVIELISNNRLNWKKVEHEDIVQSYSATFTLPNESFTIIFSVDQKRHAGFKARILKQSLSDLYSSYNFIGSIKDNMLGFTVLLCSTDQSQKAAIAAITQIEKGSSFGIKLIGKFALQLNEMEEVSCGDLNIRTLTKEELTKLKPDVKLSK